MKLLLVWVFMSLVGFTSCKDEKEKSNFAILDEFSIKELPDLEFTISSDKTVEATVPDNIILTNLTAVFTISKNASMYVGAQTQASGVTKKDFTHPLIYTVVAEDGTTQSYTVTIYTEINIKAFSIIELPNTVFNKEDNHLSAIVSNGTDRQNLTANFSITSNSQLFVNEVVQVSGETKNDFNQTLTYVLKSSNDSEKEYTVSITEAENVPPVAHAGEDKRYYIPQGETMTIVSLDGSLSRDEEGDLVSFVWKMNDETVATNSNEDISLAEGMYIITLTVTDGAGASHVDDVTITVQPSGEYIPVDADATSETKKLLANLGNIGNSDQFIFGQEFPLSFKLNGLRYDLSTSDCKDVTGDHPGVYGIDPHYMLYKSNTQRQLHIDEAKLAYQNGSVVTFDFHQQSKTDHKIYMSDITTASDKSLMYDIVHDKNNSREWFYAELDDILGIVNNDLGFPIVFRLFHEMDGDWFWWGSSATNHSAQLYIDFYQMTVGYLKERSNLQLFAWSPNSQLQQNYYPGDNYVDVVGIDVYEPSKSSLKSKLITLSDFAVNHNKVAVLSETGDRNDYINDAPEFWNDVVLDAVKEGGSAIRIAWVLSWFNASWATSQNELFIPDVNSPQLAKDEFITFKNDGVTLFEQEVKALNMYN